MFDFPICTGVSDMAHIPFNKVPKDEKQFVIEDAARTLINAKRISKDKPLMKEVNKKLDEIAKAATAAKKN